MIPTSRLNYWCAEVGAKQLHEYDGIAAALSQMDGSKGGNEGFMSSILGGVDTVLGSVRESVEKQTGTLAWKRWAALVLNWATLVGYGVAVHRLSQGGTKVGYITAGAVLVCDLTVFLCMYAGRVTTALQATLFNGICRVLLVGGGERFWFVGHSLMFVALAGFFSWSLITQHLPLKAKGETAAVMFAELGLTTPEGKALASHHPAFQPPIWAARILAAGDALALILLSLGFAASLGFNYAYSTVTFKLTDDGQEHKQYTVGVAAVFLVSVFVAGLTVVRMWKRAGRVSVGVFFVGVGAYLFCLVAGSALYRLTQVRCPLDQFSACVNGELPPLFSIEL